MIGNSRWHWALKRQQKWEYSHSEPLLNLESSRALSITKWAAVGTVPQQIFLNPKSELQLKDIPLLKIPDWLGIDRALGGWSAFKKAQSKSEQDSGLLVADAGTVLSITKITSNGEFGGGQLVPGLKLQQKIMANGTNNLIEPKTMDIPNKQFPIETEAAMLRGSLQSLIGTLLLAQKKTDLPIWLCGGDSKIIFESMKSEKIDITYCPNLVLEGMVQLINQESI